MANWQHQQDYLDNHAHDEYHGLWWEQGTGKTRALIKNAEILYEAGKIDAFFIVTVPSGGERNWVNKELPDHLSPTIAAQARIMRWSTAKSGTLYHKREFAELLAHQGLCILGMSIAAFKSEAGKKAAWEILKKKRCLYIIDEPMWEGGIKSADGKRSRSACASAKYAPYRRVADGTPVAEGPYDFYAPAKFVTGSSDYWKQRELHPFAVYKAHFSETVREKIYVAGGEQREIDKLVGYRNLDELNRYLLDIGSRVTKDVLGLPPKVYLEPIRFDLHKEQQRLYKSMKEEMIAEWDGGVSQATIPIVQLLRFQQIACGYLPNDEEDARMDMIIPPAQNPRLHYLEDIKSSTSRGKTILWSRFRQDIDLMMDILGKRAVRYDGAVDDAECERAKNEFQDGDAEFICCSYSKASTTITLHAAKHVINHCNSFKLRHRLQSEDRAHRGGLQHSVDYTDVVANDTCDERTIRALRSKRDISSTITGDELRDWI